MQRPRGGGYARQTSRARALASPNRARPGPSGRDSPMSEAPGLSPRELALTRTLDAPREAVWAAWVSPARIEQWFAPRPVAIRPGSVVADARPGGEFSLTMVLPDGSERATRGRSARWTSRAGSPSRARSGSPRNHRRRDERRVQRHRQRANGGCRDAHARMLGRAARAGHARLGAGARPACRGRRAPDWLRQSASWKKRSTRDDLCAGKAARRGDNGHHALPPRSAFVVSGSSERGRADAERR